MSWTTPRTWVAGEVVTASLMNTHVRDNLDALRVGGLALSSQAAQDFLYASSASQIARLAAASGKIPRYDGSAWGMIKPIAYAFNEYSAETSSTSGTYADTGLSVSITTQVTTSKVLIIVCQTCSGANGDEQYLALLRGSTTISTIYATTYSSLNADVVQWIARIYVDTPGAAAATTYKTQQKRNSGSGAGVKAQPSNLKSSIVCLELDV